MSLKGKNQTAYTVFPLKSTRVLNREGWKRLSYLVKRNETNVRRLPPKRSLDEDIIITILIGIYAIANKARKKFRALTGFETMASALALQYSTENTKKTHKLEAGQ